MGDLPDLENPPRHILFVDVGHSSMSVAIVAFSDGQFVVKYPPRTATDHDIG